MNQSKFIFRAQPHPLNSHLFNFISCETEQNCRTSRNNCNVYLSVNLMAKGNFKFCCYNVLYIRHKHRLVIRQPYLAKCLAKMSFNKGITKIIRSVEFTSVGCVAFVSASSLPLAHCFCISVFFFTLIPM